jgi:hypothetical protein
MIAFAYYSTCYLFHVVEANNDKNMLIREFWKEDLLKSQPPPPFSGSPFSLVPFS